MDLALAGLPNACLTRREALEVFQELAIEYTQLDGSNLHAYCKRLKQALYLAEIAAAVNPLAGQLATEFRKFHDVSGKWHDWEVLVLKARRVSHSKGKNESLVSLLEGKTAAALH